MRSLRCLACLLVLQLVPLSPLWAWGQTGHRAVGLLAERQLPKKIQRKVLQVLRGQSLAQVSNWMDDIKSDTAYNHTHDWHWVTIPQGMTYAQSQKNPNGDVVMKIDEIVEALKSKQLSPQKEEEYLKFLVHLVGDMHQPLHVGDRDDKGGNDVRVRWFGQNSNLHRVWDSDMIDGKRMSFTELADFAGKPTPTEWKEWSKLSTLEWAAVSQSQLNVIYDIPKDGNLGYRYSYDHFDRTQRCLLQAGVHLAALLIEIYG